MVCTSVVLGFVLGSVPVVGWVAEFGFMCWVDACVFVFFSLFRWLTLGFAG
jgi:hypothetical protein